jgi:hypothetical protein
MTPMLILVPGAALSIYSAESVHSGALTVHRRERPV